MSPQSSKSRVKTENTPVKPENTPVKPEPPADNRDSNYDPNESFHEYFEEDQQLDDTFEQSLLSENIVFNEDQPWKEQKFIVPWSFVVWALSCCRVCAEKENITIDKLQNGAALDVTINCNKCKASYNRSTSNYNKRLSTLNYMLSCAMLFTGSLPTKVLRMPSLIGIQVPSRSTFFDHQKYYLHKAVGNVWEDQQKNMVKQINESKGNLSIAGDARCDSMGHSAKYGSYSCMDVDKNKILTFRLVQTRGNSNAMEIEGLKLCLQQLLSHWKLKVDHFISDRHIQIRACMRDTYGTLRKDASQPHIKHYLDVWHVAKSLKKDLRNVVKLDKTGMTTKRSKAIVNHLYWVASSTNADNPLLQDIMEAKWCSLSNHMVNKHKHSNPLYTVCNHPKRRRGDRKKEYMKMDLLHKKSRIKDVRQLSPVGQTSSLEAFHSVVNHFAPKMIHFHYRAMNTRLTLAAIHFNHNDIEDLEAEQKLVVIHPKHKKGEATVRVASDDKCYGYVDDIFAKAFEFVRDDLTEEIPAPMTSLYQN